ncbi:MAG TPA: IPT/TIG domain-containing protein, partial [Actinomycetota bacterium]
MNGPTRRLAIRTSTVLFVTLTLALGGMTAAQAAAPTITLLNPTSGPVGTSVVITGTGFNDSSVVSA